MAQSGATERRTAERRPGGPGGQEREATLGRALWAVLALDAGIALVQLYVHAQIAATDGAYTSFCNVNASINCDAVLGSTYGVLFGLPLSLWALMKDALMAGLVGMRGRPGSPARTRSALLLAGLGIWTLVFSLYMAVIATWAVGAFCLLCAGMYVLSPIIALLAWRLAETRLGAAGPVLTGPRTMIGAGGAALGLAVIAAAQLGSGAASAAPRTPADVQARDPQFFEWYSGLRRVGPLPEPRHVKGPANAPITIVEFSDFECTYCAKAFRDLRDLERRYPGQVRVSFHHYPLDSACNPKMTGQLHTRACLAAIAAECAARYGKFWEYHDRLFDAQGDLTRPALLATAATLGIEATAFSTCLDDPAVRALVLADTEAGAALGVQSTPTIIVNGRSIEGALDRSAYDYVMAIELHS